MTRRSLNLFDCLVILAVLLLVGGILFALATLHIPNENQSLFAAMSTGVVGAVLLIWANFRWGGAQNSENKDAQIAQLTSHVVDIAKMHVKTAAAPAPEPPAEEPEGQA